MDKNKYTFSEFSQSKNHCSTTNTAKVIPMCGFIKQIGIHLTFGSPWQKKKKEEKRLKRSAVEENPSQEVDPIAGTDAE